MKGCNNVKLGSADVAILSRGYTSWMLIGPIWSRSVTSHVLFTLLLLQGRPPVANIFSQLSAMLFLAFIFWLSHNHSGEIWGWSCIKVVIHWWPETGCNRPTPALDSNLSPISIKMAVVTVCGAAAEPTIKILIRCQWQFRVKPSSTRELIWTALVQHTLWINRDQVLIWTWLKLDRRWCNAP